MRTCVCICVLWVWGFGWKFPESDSRVHKDSAQHTSGVSLGGGGGILPPLSLSYALSTLLFAHITHTSPIFDALLQHTQQISSVPCIQPFLSVSLSHPLSFFFLSCPHPLFLPLFNTILLKLLVELQSCKAAKLLRHSLLRKSLYLGNGVVFKKRKKLWL